VGPLFFLIAITLIIVQGLGINPRAYNYLPSLPAVIASNILFGAGFALFATALSLVMLTICLPHWYQIFLYPVGTNSCVCLIWDNGATTAWMLVSFITVLKPRRAPCFLRDSLRDVAAESRDDQKVSTALGEAISTGEHAQSKRCVARLVCRAAPRPLTSYRRRVGGALATRSLQQCRDPRAAA
jgi:hypothetical protein